MAKAISSAFVMTFLTISSTSAQIAVAPKVGTLGLGGDVAIGIANGINARIGVNWADLDLDHDLSNISYNANLDLQSYTAMLDWHVFGGSFRLIGGLIWNENKASLDATPRGTINIGGTDYPASDVGKLIAKVTYDNELAPYVGIGWGNPIGGKGRFGVLLDVGVAFTGAPKARLSATGSISLDPTFQQSMQQEQDELNDDLDMFRFYPVLAISLFVRF